MESALTTLLNTVLSNKLFRIVAIVLSVFFIYKAGEAFGKFLHLVLN